MADRRVTAALAGGLVGLLDLTVRVTVVGGGRLEEAERAAGGFIYGFWHGQLLLAALVHDGKPTAAMISRHGDGELIARVVARRGIHPVRGSTTRGGGEAFRGLLELVEAGWTRLAITPDGPRGPKHAVQPGIVRLAAATGFAIVPAGLAARPAHRLASWDGFTIPWPGAQVTVHYGPPIPVPPNPDPPSIEAIQGQLGAALNALTHQAAARPGAPTNQDATS